jgi:hypothetical protein
MPVPPEVRIPIENETLMKVYQPALGESLDAIPEEHKVLFHGFAHVGNCESYYIITHAGIHYCDQERLGLFKKRYVPRYFSLDSVETIDVETRPGSAYIRFFKDGRMALVMWFQDELSSFRGMSAEDEAMRFANKFGT